MSSEKQLSRSIADIQKEYYQYLFNCSSFGIVGTDCQGMIVSWNLAAEKIFQAGSAQMLGRHVTWIVPEGQRPELQALIERAVMQRESNELEVEHRDGQGERITLAVVVAPILDEAGTLLGLSFWVRDITNRKTLQRQLAHAEKMASLGTLASGVAHHFNNIIGGVATYVDFALQSNNPQTLRQALKMTAEAANRVSHITESLLTFAEKDYRQFDLSDLTEVLLNFAHLVEKPLAEKHIKLEVQIMPVPIVEVPGSRILQVLGNLLDNAENAMPGGGTVRVRLEPKGEQVMLEFSDTGCGIHPRDLPHIFEPFFTTRGIASGGDHPSAGLGLSVVHGILGELGASIEAASELHQGSTFTLYFPVRRKLACEPGGTA